MSEPQPSVTDESNRRLGAARVGFVRSSAALIGLRAVGFGASFLFSLVLASSAGADGAGQYYLAVAVTTLGYVASKLGTDGSLLRLIGEGDPDSASMRQATMYRSAWILVGGSSLIVTVFLVVAAPWIATGIYGDASIAAPLRITALGIPAMALTSVTGRSLLAIGRPFVGSAVEGGALSVVQLLVYLVALRGAGVVGAAASLLIANVALLIVGVWRWSAASHNSSPAKPEVKRLLSESIPFLSTDVLSVVSGFVGTVALGALATTADAGVYAVGSRVAKLGALALIPLTTLIAPQFARAGRERDLVELRRHLRASSFWLAGLALVVTAAVVAVAPLAASLLGRDFTDSVSTMRLLAIGYGINIGTGASVVMLQMTGRAVVVTHAMVAATVLQIVLSVLLIPEFGPEGAALASVAAIVLKSVACTWVSITASSPGRDDGSGSS